MSASLSLVRCQVDLKPWRWQRWVLVFAVWVGVGVFSGLQLFMTNQGSGLGLASLLSLQILHASPWVAVTFITERIALIYSPRNRSRRWKQLLLLVGAGVGVVFAVNIIQGMLRVAFGFSPLDTFPSEVLGGLLMWGHFALVVYGALLLMWSILTRDQSIKRHDPVQATSSHVNVLTVRKGAYNLKIATETIDWIEGARDYVLIHCNGASYTSNQRMSWLEDHLDPQQFARIHRSSIVNLSRVAAYKPQSHGDYELKLQDGTALTLTRTRREAVLALLQ